MHSGCCHKTIHVTKLYLFSASSLLPKDYRIHGILNDTAKFMPNKSIRYYQYQIKRGFNWLPFIKKISVFEF